jgi:hypothetical protein
VSGYTFTPSAEADAERLAKYQAAFAKLAPSCVRCGHRLAKGELDARVCRDREICRIRRSGCSVTGFATVRKQAALLAERRAARVADRHEQDIAELADRRERAAVEAVAAVEVAAASVLPEAPEPVEVEPVEDLDPEPGDDLGEPETAGAPYPYPDPEQLAPVVLVATYAGSSAVPTYAPDLDPEAPAWRWYGRGGRRLTPAD